MKKAELKELIKTSILEDYSQNFPDDIKWEFSGEIIDQMDQYNATIGLVGHSESTGKDYAASAEASRGGAGGDWEWMEEDEVEELAEGLDPIAEADAIVEAWTSKNTLTENKQAGIQELKRILNDAAALGDEARQIFEMYFPNELRTAEAYDVFSFGSSSNSYDTTLASLIADMEEESDEE